MKKIYWHIYSQNLNCFDIRNQESELQCNTCYSCVTGTMLYFRATYQKCALPMKSKLAVKKRVKIKICKVSTANHSTVPYYNQPCAALAHTWNPAPVLQRLVLRSAWMEAKSDFTLLKKIIIIIACRTTEAKNSWFKDRYQLQWKILLKMKS